MNIIKPQYDWAFDLTKRTQTTHLILHHSATKNSSAEDIHAYHRSLGWAGIAYHFLVRKDGSVYEGRPIDTMGGHTKNYNAISVGVCFEGNFDEETMSESQMKAGAELVAYIRKKYTKIVVGEHKDFNATLCAGTNFPFTKLISSNDEGDVEEENIEPSEWAKEACDWAVNNEILKGDGNGNYNWHSYITREEIALVLKRFAEIN